MSGYLTENVGDLLLSNVSKGPLSSNHFPARNEPQQDQLRGMLYKKFTTLDQTSLGALFGAEHV
jgi:hypothetical protein